MNLLEYQSKKLLSGAGIPVPRGVVVRSAKEAREAFSSLGIEKCVLKAQIAAGGRGISGGIRFVSSIEEAEEASSQLLGKALVTPQTGPKGKEVKIVLLEEAIDVEKEFYVGLAIDRSISKAVLICSPEGGKSIEDVAGRSPEKVFREEIDPVIGLRPEQAKRMATNLGLEGRMAEEAAGIMTRIAEFFERSDALLAEVNPLALTREGFIALDAKVAIDDNALFRHRDISSLMEEEDPLEKEARESGITYIRMDGDIGCLVNGAGLAMATMDLIRLAGGEPADFLDIGGGAHSEQASSAFRILFSDPNIKSVFVNIFGGMIHCDMIAQGVVEALRRLKPAIPIVIRFEGTNSEEGMRILSASGLPLTIASSMEEGARKAVIAAYAAS